MKKIFFLLFVFCFFKQYTFSQSTCPAAVTLTPGTQQCGTNNNVGSFPDGGGAPTNPCNSSYNDGEYWFTYTGTGNALQLNVSGLTSTYSGLFVFNNCPGSSPTCIASYTSGSSSSNFSLTTPTLTLGQTYYIVMSNWSTPYSTNFCIDATAVTPPANDLCANATALPCGTTNLAGTTVNTTNISDPIGCASNFGVWYTFTGNGQVTTISSTATFDHEMVISSGSCGALTNIICDDGSTGTESHTFTTTNGVVYYVYIAHYSTSSTTKGTFTISRTCTAPPTPPANDLCANATALPCGTTNLAGTTVNTTNVVNGTGCTLSNYGVWYTFVGDGNNTTISTNPAFDIKLSISTGSCGSLSNIVCTDASPETATFATVNGTTYFVYIAHYSSSSTTTGTFTISRSCTAPLVNDECTGAISLTVNPDLTCTTTTAGTVAAATGSANANSCFGTDDDDVWFSFVATGTTHYVDLLNVAGSVTDMYHVLYSGSCASLTQLYCSDANSSAATGLTIGNTYFVRVYTYTSTGGQNSTFDLCITSDPPPVSACSGTYYDSGGSGGSYTNNEYYTQTYCSSTPGQCLVMTFTSFNTESCCDDLTIYNGPDVTSPVIGTYAGTSLPNGGIITASSGCLTIEFDSDFSTPSSGWAFTLSCGACPVPTCSDGVMNGTETGVDCGGSCPACPSIGPCGNLTNNDFCSDPAVLTQGGSGWSSSTNPIYTADDPGTGTSFCGSMDNNSWYIFTASATTEVFDFTSVTNCNYDWGIQAEVYSVTTNANGCCTGFTSYSNCMNPTIATPGTVTATGLTIGNDYYLMVDGYAGDGCDFTVANWSATGILPVTLVNFKGHNYKTGNKLVWTTKTEVNNDYFIIQRSKDAKNFTDIGIVDGNGNSNIENNYEFIDDASLSGINYYRLKQIDFNGDYEHSRIIVLKSINNIDVAIYPNPSSENLFFDLSESSDEVLTVQYTNMLGSTITESISTNQGENTYQVKEFKNLKSGIYMIKIINSNNEIIKYQKVVKK